jgi:hypothetical protein
VILVHPSGSLLKHHEPPLWLASEWHTQFQRLFFPSWMVTITRGAWWSKTIPKRINGAVHLVWVFSHRHWMQELLVDHPEGVVGWHCSSWGGRPGHWALAHGAMDIQKSCPFLERMTFLMCISLGQSHIDSSKDSPKMEVGFSNDHLAPTAALLVEVIDTQVNLRCTMPLCKLGHFRQVEVK